MTKTKTRDSKKPIYIYFECAGKSFWSHNEMLAWRRKHAKGAATYIRSTDRDKLET